MINRSRSSGDGRRRYVHLERSALEGLQPGRRRPPERALFVCTRNSARSPTRSRAVASATTSAGGVGRHPSRRSGAPRRGRRGTTRQARPRRRRQPRSIDQVVDMPPLVITVCDQAHEELDRARHVAALVDPRPGTDGINGGVRRHRPRAAPTHRQPGRVGPGVSFPDDFQLDVEVETGTGAMRLDLPRRLVAEAVGTGFLSSP